MHVLIKSHHKRTHKQQNFLSPLVLSKKRWIRFLIDRFYCTPKQCRPTSTIIEIQKMEGKGKDVITYRTMDSGLITRHLCLSRAVVLSCPYQLLVVQIVVFAYQQPLLLYLGVSFHMHGQNNPAHRSYLRYISCNQIDNIQLMSS